MVVTLYLSIPNPHIHTCLQLTEPHVWFLDCGGSSGTRREPRHMQGCNANSTINASGWIQTQNLLTVMR